MSKAKPIYLLDPKLTWKNFQGVYGKIAIKDGGPAPEHFDKVLWQMNRDGQIYVWLDGESKEDTIFTGLKLPAKRPVAVVTNPTARKLGRK